MDAISKFIKFEPIDLTQIIIVILVLFALIVFFRGELSGFLDSLQKRDIQYIREEDSIKFLISAPASVQPVISASNPASGSNDQLNNWGMVLENIDGYESFEKLGFSDLYSSLESLDSSQIGVIDFYVNDPSKNYFRDEDMLKYLSIASEKIQYLAFYENGSLKGVVDIKTVIAGIASGALEFKNFGDKLNTDQWEGFPGLIRNDLMFTEVPSIQELYDVLDSSNSRNLPLVKLGRIEGFLGYESVANELYRRASEES